MDLACIRGASIGGKQVVRQIHQHVSGTLFIFVYVAIRGNNASTALRGMLVWRDTRDFASVVFLERLDNGHIFRVNDFLYERDF